MSIITSVPALNAIVKGVGSTFTLDKAALAANSVVSADPYYSNMVNWDRVTIVYRSSVGNQSHKVIFDATQTTPTAPFFASDRARDIFEVVRVTIFDFDSGFISVQRADLTTAEFDVDMSSIPSAIEPFSLTLINPSLYVLSNSNFTCERNAANFGTYGFNYSNNAIPMTTGKFYKEIVFDANGFSANDHSLGIRLMNTPPSVFGPTGISGLIGSADNQYQVIYFDGGEDIFLLSQIGQGGITSILSGIPRLSIGDKISFALDFTSGSKDFYMAINGVWLNSANPTTGAGKIELTTVFPGLPAGLDLYFAFSSLSPAVWSIQQVPLYTPVGYTNI